MAVVRDVFMICIIAGVSVSEIVCRRVEGMVSREQVVGSLERRRVLFSVREGNEESDALFDGSSSRASQNIVLFLMSCRKYLI